jgi:hypothetical protein
MTWQNRFDRLLKAMAKGEPPKGRKPTDDSTPLEATPKIAVATHGGQNANNQTGSNSRTGSE